VGETVGGLHFSRSHEPADRAPDSGGKDDNGDLLPVLQLPHLLSKIADCFCVCFEVSYFGVNRLKLAQNSSFEGIDPPIQFGEFKVCIRKPRIYLFVDRLDLLIQSQDKVFQFPDVCIGC
jgi:hypothetical protein